MAWTISPLQPFKVRHQSVLSSLQLQSLIQLYQPIIGKEALALYLTLYNLPLEEVQWSQTRIHSELFTILNMGVPQTNEARMKLEAIGLMRTYRDSSSQADINNQSFLYDLQLPLDFKQFMDNSLLSTLLFERIGDQSFNQLLRSWRIDRLDTQRYVEITTNFDQVFQPLSSQTTYNAIQEEMGYEAFRHQKAETFQAQVIETFDYSVFLKHLMNEAIDHTDLTQALKEEVLAIHTIYGLNEWEMVNLVRLAINQTTGHIETFQLKEIASKRAFHEEQTNQKSQSAQKTNGEENKRKQSLTKEYPDLTAEEIHLIYVSEQIPCDVFVKRIKQLKNGFATDQEIFYVKDLLEKSQLNQTVINILVYYLLVIQDRTNVFKGALERTANEWQQKGIETGAEALEEIKAQQKLTKIQKEKKQTQFNQGYKRRTRKEADVPTWMNQSNAPPSTESAEENVSQQQLEDEAARLQAQLQEMFNNQQKG